MKQVSTTQLIELQKMLLTLGKVERKVSIPGSEGRFENDIEHSYSLSMLSWLLAPQVAHLSVEKLLKMSLVHDMVEVYAGDIFTYGTPEQAQVQAAAEEQAFARLRDEWSDFPEMLSTIEEYMQDTTPEAKFMHALDKLQPTIMDCLDEWHTVKQLGITSDKYWSKKQLLIDQTPELAEYYNALRTLFESLE